MEDVKRYLALRTFTVPGHSWINSSWLLTGRFLFCPLQWWHIGSYCSIIQPVRSSKKWTQLQFDKSGAPHFWESTSSCLASSTPSSPYWSSDQGLHMELVAVAMTVNRFGTIMRFIHFKDNPARISENKDRLLKLWPILNHIQKTFLEALSREELVCLWTST